MLYFLLFFIFYKNKFEIATKIYKPSYISFETVLSQSGVIFQYYSQIFVASYLTREIEVDGQKYFYRKINKE
jgi:predicted transcriptional regulator of viral defense system